MLDLLGWDAEKAIRRLSSEGFPWTTEITNPPRKPLDNGYFRVIKQEFVEDTYRLILCKVPDSFR